MKPQGSARAGTTFPAMPQPRQHPAGHGHGGFSKPGAGSPPNPSATLPMYSPWQKEVILASPPRKPGLGLACVNGGKSKGQMQGLAGLLSWQPQHRARGCWVASRGHGPSPTPLTCRVEEWTGGHVPSHRLWLQQEHPARCRSAMPHPEHRVSSHSSHIHWRTSPSAAVGGRPLSCPAGLMASALPSHVLGWRDRAERCPPQPPSRVLWPLPAHAKARAGAGDPPIVPSPTSKSLRDDLGFALHPQE